MGVRVEFGRKNVGGGEEEGPEKEGQVAAQEVPCLLAAASELTQLELRVTASHLPDHVMIRVQACLVNCTRVLVLPI